MFGCQTGDQLHTQNAIADHKTIPAQSLGFPASSKEKIILSQDWGNFKREDSKKSTIYEIHHSSDKATPETLEKFDNTEELYEMPYHYPRTPCIPSNPTTTYSTQE